MQVVPSAAVGLEQMPVVESQSPARWQGSCGVQATGLEPVQRPAWQASLCVHESPSEHVAPFALLGIEQAPVAELQTPGS